MNEQKLSRLRAELAAFRAKWETHQPSPAEIEELEAWLSALQTSLTDRRPLECSHDIQLSNGPPITRP